MKAINILKAITLVNVLVATGFAIAGVVAPAALLPADVAVNQGTEVFALYAAARTIPLALIAIYIIIKGHRQALFAIGALAAFIQFVDGFVGIYQHDTSKIYGPFVLGIMGFVALYSASKAE